MGNHDTTRFLNDAAATPHTLELAFTILTTMRGMPQIYSGDEIAMHGGEDPDNRHDFPGGFGKVQNDAFTAQGRTPEQQQMFSTLQALLTLRRSHPALQLGMEQVLHTDQNLFVYARTLREERILIAVNKGNENSNVVVGVDGTSLEGISRTSILFGSAEAISINKDGLNFKLAPQTAVILDLNQPNLN